MAPKSDKEKKAGKTNPDLSKPSSKKEVPQPKKEEEDDDIDELDEDIEETPKKPGKAAATSKKKKEDEDEEEDDAAEEVDDWEKVEEEEEWDPDFDEFDIPKSKGKKAAPVGTTPKKGADDDDEFKIDDEFKDMFGNENNYDEEEEDY